MNENERKAMAGFVDTLDDQYRKGGMSLELYARAMVLAAHEYASGDEMKLAAEALRRCPADYFEGAMRVHMAEDKRFEVIAFEVAQTLAAKGLIDELRANMSFNQATGLA